MLKKKLLIQEYSHIPKKMDFSALKVHVGAYRTRSVNKKCDKHMIKVVSGREIFNKGVQNRIKEETKNDLKKMQEQYIMNKNLIMSSMEYLQIPG